MNKDLLQRLNLVFQEVFEQRPLIAFAPGRINIIGEHTDYNDGFVFPAAIDKGIMAAVSGNTGNTTKVIAMDLNDQMELNLNALQPLKNGGWKNYVIGVIAEIKKMRPELQNFNLVFGGDLPIGSGMSSSAALENSIGYAINAFFNLGLSRLELIKIAQRADHNYVGVKSGIMDQYASMFGKKDSALLIDCRALTADAYPLILDDYTLLLINTNVSHALASSAYNNRRATCEKVAKMLNKAALRDVSIDELKHLKNNITEDEYNKCAFVIAENHRVHQAASCMAQNDLEGLGKLLYASHEGLQHKYQVSCDELDFLVELTKSNKAILGARMMGGGFGGCTINLIKNDHIKQFQTQTAERYKEKFNKDCTFYEVHIDQGTQLVQK